MTVNVRHALPTVRGRHEFCIAFLAVSDEAKLYTGSSSGAIVDHNPTTVVVKVGPTSGIWERSLVHRIMSNTYSVSTGIYRALALHCPVPMDRHLCAKRPGSPPICSFEPPPPRLDNDLLASYRHISFPSQTGDSDIPDDERDYQAQPPNLEVSSEAGIVEGQGEVEAFFFLHISTGPGQHARRHEITTSTLVSQRLNRTSHLQSDITKRSAVWFMHITIARVEPLLASYALERLSGRGLNTQR